VLRGQARAKEAQSLGLYWAARAPQDRIDPPYMTSVY
jgi:hypothetical protein